MDTKLPYIKQNTGEMIVKNFQFYLIPFYQQGFEHTRYYDNKGINSKNNRNKGVLKISAF